MNVQPRFRIALRNEASFRINDHLAGGYLSLAEKIAIPLDQRVHEDDDCKNEDDGDQQSIHLVREAGRRRCVTQKTMDEFDRTIQAPPLRVWDA